MERICMYSTCGVRCQYVSGQYFLSWLELPPWTSIVWIISQVLFEVSHNLSVLLLHFFSSCIIIHRDTRALFHAMLKNEIQLYVFLYVMFVELRYMLVWEKYQRLVICFKFYLFINYFYIFCFTKKGCNKPIIWLWNDWTAYMPVL